MFALSAKIAASVRMRSSGTTAASPKRSWILFCSLSLYSSATMGALTSIFFTISRISSPRAFRSSASFSPSTVRIRSRFSVAIRTACVITPATSSSFSTSGTAFITSGSEAISEMSIVPSRSYVACSSLRLVIYCCAMAELILTVTSSSVIFSMTIETSAFPRLSFSRITALIGSSAKEYRFGIFTVISEYR